MYFACFHLESGAAHLLIGAQHVRPIYVHSKMAIVDDEIMLTGSTNMDSMSFFHSSEVSVTITSKSLAKDTKARLVREVRDASTKRARSQLTPHTISRTPTHC